jgi:hypothetical protein
MESYMLMDYVRVKHVLAICLLSLAAVTAQGQAVPTAEYNNARTNANDNEFLLNPTNVNSSTFGKVGTWVLDGDIAGQPLYVPGLNIGTRVVNALYVATMNNSVYALDADHPGSSPLWKVNLGPTVPASYAGKCPAPFALGNLQLGILSTPVIDTDSMAIYVVATNPVSNQPAYGFTLYALDLRTGQQKLGGSVPISASIPGTGSASVNGTVAMGKINLLQRPALLLSRQNVYIGFGACGFDISPFHGWVLGYNASNIQKQTVVFNTTPNGDMGGIWQSGEGLVADAHGSIYFEVGNGDTDEQTNFGESFVKLSSTGAVQSFFTPSNTAMLTTLDEDLSSTAPLLTPDTNLLIGGSKQGLVYVLNASSLGGVGNDVQTFRGGTQCDPVTYSQCKKIHSLAYWRALDESRLYVWAADDNLRAFAYKNGMFDTTPESESPETFAYPGAMLTVTSAQGDPKSGIVWALTPGVLHAFQATNVANELWNSNQNPQRDALVGGYHFAQSTVVNGEVFVPDGQNKLVVYGPVTPGSIRVTSPHGGETWTKGWCYDFTWTYAGLINPTVNLQIVDTVHPGFSSQVFSGIPKGSNGTGVYHQCFTPNGWNIGYDTHYKLQVTDTNISAVSATEFSLQSGSVRTTSPNGGEVWRRGTTQNITWAWGGNIGTTVKIELLLNHSTISVITAATASGWQGTGPATGTGSFSWTIPNNLPVASGYQIRVTSNLGTSTIPDASDAPFNIN